jgi:hypothetical protein
VDILEFGLNEKDVRAYFFDMVRSAMNRKRAYEVVDKNDYTVLLGFASTHPSNFDTKVKVPQSWKAAIEMEKFFRDKFEAKFPDYLSYEYGESGFISPAGGKRNVALGFMSKIAEY